MLFIIKLNYNNYKNINKMLRNTILRRFCVSNKDPVHVRNAQNDHRKKAFDAFREKPKDRL